jgi:exoribonuclease-2
MDVYPGFHSSLGLSSYVSITSPLRKYLDLVTQRQLISYMQGESPYYGEKDLKNIASTTQSFLTKGAIVKQERKRYWLLKVMQERIGEKLNALVLDIKFRGCTAVLLDYLLAVHLAVPEPHSITPGDTVPVVIQSVDPFTMSLKVRLAGE